ncbi:MAG: RES family NAD+ phosphorylase, partial [Candidatus Eremiobacteraeota bacterium]|nr:RES family NAD+ phosphorylase [Candidatus Eremiobacteraeota bacterium]
MDIPVTRVQWRAAKRIISTRYPSVGILDRLVDASELDALLAIDARTNPRMNEELGALAVIPPAERVVGPGSTVIMAPFAHPNPDGSRFSDGRFGVFYAAHRLPTAVAEVRYHRERFMRASHEVAQTLELMLYEASIRGGFHDIRASENGDWYSPVSYARSQPLGVRLHKAGSDGIAYRSVRDPSGECLAVFRPTRITRCRAVKPLFAHWDGTQITTFTTPLRHSEV